MKLSTLTLALMVCIGSGCASLHSTSQVATSDLPNCLDSNYDAQRSLFTIRNADARTVSQQCALVGPSGDTASTSRLAAGRYAITLANGGGGGAGGGQTGGGGGGAGAMEERATVNLAEGMYKLTIGAGGPAGGGCADFRTVTFPGGPGWAGSPSNIVRVATGEVILGTPGADTYARPSRGENERLSGKQDGHGGSGPGQATGGDGGSAATVNAEKERGRSWREHSCNGAYGSGRRSRRRAEGCQWLGRRWRWSNQPWCRRRPAAERRRATWTSRRYAARSAVAAAAAATAIRAPEAATGSLPCAGIEPAVRQSLAWIAAIHRHQERKNPNPERAGIFLYPWSPAQRAIPAGEATTASAPQRAGSGPSPR